MLNVLIMKSHPFCVYVASTVGNVQVMIACRLIGSSVQGSDTYQDGDRRECFLHFFYVSCFEKTWLLEFILVENKVELCWGLCAKIFIDAEFWLKLYF